MFQFFVSNSAQKFTGKNPFKLLLPNSQEIGTNDLKGDLRGPLWEVFVTKS